MAELYSDADDIFQPTECEPWPTEDNDVDSDLEFENRRYYEERLVPEGEDEEDDIPPFTTISSDISELAIKVKTVIFSPELPEYPKTSEAGVAYLINVENMSMDEIKLLSEAPQYCRKRLQPPRSGVSSILNNVKCTRYSYICTGVKACEYLHPDITNMHHTSLSHDDWDTIKSLRQKNSIDSKSKQANSFFLSIRNQFKKMKACHNQQETCKYIFQQGNTETISGVPMYSIHCINSQEGQPHFFKPIPQSLHTQISFLQTRFSQEEDEMNSTCHIVEPTTTRRPHCGEDHVQGAGKLIPYSCDVHFRLFKPDDIQACPYIIWTSHGVHSHPPPPPSQTPHQLISGLIKIIRRIQDPSLTMAGLLKNIQLQQFCQQYGGESLSEIHKSFANTDKISLILRKQRMLNNPHGEFIAGVRHRYVLEEGSPKQYIRHIYYDSQNLVILCFFKQQAELLLNLQSFEVDMGFKRIRHEDIHEIVFTAFIPELNKIMIFVRAYINQETTHGYEYIFKEVFRLISILSGKEITWRHMSNNNSGFIALVMDMDSKQLSGFGKYLSGIDPQHRSWQWHVQRTVIYCSIHFERGIRRAAGTTESSKSVSIRMKSLIECQSEREYFQLTDLLQRSDLSSQTVKDWAKHKAQSCIASGINLYCSKMQKDLFVTIRNHTNASEQTHFKSNSFGRRLPLLRAIDMGRILDGQDIDQYNVKINYGIHHSYRTSSLSARFNNSETRERRKRKRKTRDDIEEDILDQASSSGSIRRSRSRSIRSRSTSSSQSRSQSEARSASVIRRPSSQISLRQSATINNQSIADQLNNERARLELQREAANIRRIELENERAELELIRLRRDLQNTDNNII